MSAPIPQAEWRIVRAAIDEMIERARDNLEHNNPETDTAALRGRIKALRALIAWGEPEPIPEIDQPPDYLDR